MSNSKINLILPDSCARGWNLGDIYTCPQPKLLDSSGLLNCDALLFWDPVLGIPPESLAKDFIGSSADVWHAGLNLGMKGLPQVIDFVMPDWMFNCDPAPEIEATSWRLTLSACLIRTDVIKKMGWLRPEFRSLEAATLEMGHRWITGGVFMRHVPALINNNLKEKNQSQYKAKFQISFEDELLFIRCRFGNFWTKWSLGRAVLSGYVNIFKAWQAYKELSGFRKENASKPYRNEPLPYGVHRSASVTVLIPTLDRYPYLRTLLDQLRRQTILAHEIIIVDQTDSIRRDSKLKEDFGDLPIKLIYQDQAGQCTSRNAGLKSAEGDYILFLDDDDEIAPDLIEKHLNNLEFFKCAVSSGIVEETGIAAIPESLKTLRASDVFPTNNTMIRKEILEKSGLFDLAYNRKQRADGDLGMRVYLSGAHMILNPSISLIHHHAPQGGLRVHKARVMTYGKSRKSFFMRHLPSDSEIYLGKRYFSKTQVREMIWMRFFGTFSIRGGKMRKFMKLIISIMLFPHTVWAFRKAILSADFMRQHFPSIPRLSESKA